MTIPAFVLAGLASDFFYDPFFFWFIGFLLGLLGLLGFLNFIDFIDFIEKIAIFLNIAKNS